MIIISAYPPLSFPDSGIFTAISAEKWQSTLAKEVYVPVVPTECIICGLMYKSIGPGYVAKGGTTTIEATIRIPKILVPVIIAGGWNCNIILPKTELMSPRDHNM